MAANADSIEALTLQEHYTTLVEGLQDHALPVAASLFSRRQISFQELQAIQQINLTAMERSQALVNAILNAIVVNTGVYLVFMEVLGEKGCANPILDKLRSTYGTYYIPWMNQLLYSFGQCIYGLCNCIDLWLLSVFHHCIVSFHTQVAITSCTLCNYLKLKLLCQVVVQCVYIHIFATCMCLYT